MGGSRRFSGTPFSRARPHFPFRRQVLAAAKTSSESAKRVSHGRENPVNSVALVGPSCRFPGAQSPQDLWRFLRSGSSAVAQVPEGRWDNDLFTEVDEPEAFAVRQGGFLDDVAGFDPRFFNISPREAAKMDPRQRLMLEPNWEALEDASITRVMIGGRRVGVVLGAAGDDYGYLVRQRGSRGVTQHTFTGSLRGVIANRISHFLGLRGPSIVAATGQSSSLVAVHLAVESLLKGESEITIAGGVALHLTPHAALAAYRFGALSPDGRCSVFDERANGFVQGEGGGVVVLKPLDAALADKDVIYCVIRGSAAWWTPSPLRRQSRRIFQIFMRTQTQTQTQPGPVAGNGPWPTPPNTASTSSPHW